MVHPIKILALIIGAFIVPRGMALKSGHPIGGVIDLLKKLTVQAKEEGQTEAATFQKFSYWCKTSTKKLNKAITKEKANIKRFTDQISGLKKEVETLTSDIDILTAQISEQETAGTKATAQRKNESDLYTVTYKNIDDTITAVDDAVEVMEAAETEQLLQIGTGLKHLAKKASLMHASFLQGRGPYENWSPPPEASEGDEMKSLDAELNSLDVATKARAKHWKTQSGLTQSVTALKTATKELTSTKDTALTSTKAQVDKQEPLPPGFEHINLNPGAKNPFKKGKVKVYTEHEGEIVETFRDIEGGLEHDKLDVHQREANAQNAYELAKKSRDFAIAAAKENKKEKEDIKGDKESELAKAEADLKSEEDELTADSATLDSTDQECKQVVAGYEQRVKVRTGEITAMDMAVKILAKVSGVRDPDTHEIPKKASLLRMHINMQGGKFQSLSDHLDENVDLQGDSVSFLQVQSPKEKACALLRAAGKKAHSGALIKLAAEIQAYGGPFAKIKSMIQKMIFQLQGEQKDEDDHKNWCDLETQTNTEKKDDGDEKIKMMKIKAEELDAEIKIAMKDIKANNEKLSDLTAYMETETQLREENKAEIELTIKDAQAGAEAVAQATAVLKDFYKESGMVAKEPWEFIQTSMENSMRGVSLPDSPDTWDSSYTGAADPADPQDGVLGILDGVAQKFAAMESDAKLQDTTDQKDYDKDMASKKVEIAEVKTDTQMKTQKQTSLQEKLDGVSSKLKHVESENYAVRQYLKDLEPACAGPEGSYEDRKKARSDEITALRKAQTILEDAFRAKL
eukprot:gnl/MRDRNA2_/MRDRNA2_59940_c0_seq1.p1 gnl/MRDRNA2_/MRDRNA2_59940_c0~~gnl/MRDRNA2_/MRDRNA2_59940_c0_seq1.p1  ORF type:complete len:800 (+),score=259.35 gnl/MRDRNA2_/MRDRNA2_59940_c0_seq1:100-2499(+)